MRASLFVMFALLSAFVVGGCDCGGHGGCDESRSGQAGGCCRADGCDDGLTCVEASCQPCGTEAGRCCYDPMTLDGTCNAGLTCVSPATGSEVCQACGMIGGPCCEGSGSLMCPSGSACISGTCQSGATLCPPGPTRFAVGITDSSGCALREISIDTNTFENAVQCASTMLRAGEVVYSDAPGVSREYSVCVRTRMEGDRNATIRAYDDYGARTCACMGAVLGCTVTYSACPGT